MRVIVATAKMFTDSARLHRKLDRVLGKLKRLVVHCRRRERDVKEWCSKRIGGLYCVYQPDEPDAEMLLEADALVAFRGQRPCMELERLVAAARKKGLKVRVIEHKD